MNTPHGSALGREVAYPSHYDPALLFPIPRAAGRAALGIDGDPPFIGHDRWHAYELSWLDLRGRPRVATASLTVPGDSPNLIESKSLKLYLNSLNAARFPDAGQVLERIAHDLSRAAGAAVHVEAGVPPAPATGEAGAWDDPARTDIDDADVDILAYGPPDPGLLRAAGEDVHETLHSSLLKSNCPVTGQPDWASVWLAYRGPRIDRGGLLAYLASFRDHAEFHEQCVERIFVDVRARCAPSALSVQARYTRRGGLDINPWRATPGTAPPPARRDLRQ